jgi:hypothetical protein
MEKAKFVYYVLSCPFSSFSCEIVRGQDYQEVVTNFPFGTQLLTGVFLEMELSGPGVPTETFERALVDRFGIAARQNGGSSSIDAADGSKPILSELDLFTINVLAGVQDANVVQTLTDALAPLAERVASAQSGGSIPPDVAGTFRDFVIGLNQLQALTFLTLSDFLTPELAEASLVRAYYNRPRLTIASHTVTTDEVSGEPQVTIALDLRRDNIRALAFPGQSTSAPRTFQTFYGASESAAEAASIAQLDTATGPPQTVNASSVFQAALDQDIGLTILTGDDFAQLETIYAHLESPTTTGQTTSGPGNRAGVHGMDGQERHHPRHDGRPDQHTGQGDQGDRGPEGPRLD